MKCSRVNVERCDKYGKKRPTANQERGRYEGWNYYHYGFCIYDDDPEIRGVSDAANFGELGL